MVFGLGLRLGLGFGFGFGLGLGLGSSSGNVSINSLRGWRHLNDHCVTMVDGTHEWCGPGAVSEVNGRLACKQQMDASRVALGGSLV